MRLIDADTLKEEVNKKKVVGRFNTLLLIDNAPTVDFEKLGESLNCQIRATYGSCDDCLLSCPRNELIKLLGLARPQGKWKRINEEDNDVECPFCGFQEDGIYYNFCPECGAYLKGEVE